MFSWGQLQRELVPWQDHNFPNRPAWMPLLGIAEELGEYFEADTREDLDDALADIAIFMSDFANSQGIDLDVLFVEPAEIKNPVRSYGKLCHYFLKQEQGIRHTPDKCREGIEESLCYFHAWLEYKSGRDVGILALAEKTWAKVKLRNWRP